MKREEKHSLSLSTAELNKLAEIVMQAQSQIPDPASQVAVELEPLIEKIVNARPR